MTREQVQMRLEEYAAIRPDAGGDVTALVEAALFVEEVFGLTVADEDIAEDCLGSRAALLQFVLGRLQVV